MNTFKCQECGRKFKTAKAAERAVNNGCPNCGGVDIDLDSTCYNSKGLHKPAPPPSHKNDCIQSR